MTLFCFSWYRALSSDRRASRFLRRIKSSVKVVLTTKLGSKGVLIPSPPTPDRPVAYKHSIHDLTYKTPREHQNSKRSISN